MEDFKFDEEDKAADIGNVSLEVDVQPHLPAPPSKRDVIAARAEAAAQAEASSSVESNNTSRQVDLNDNKANNQNELSENHETSFSHANGGSDMHSSPVQVQYDSSEGKVNVMPSAVVTRTDGSQYIDTQGIPQRWSELERPLRQKKMKYLKIFSIIACVFFFPSGIPAVYYAFRTEKEFNEGIMRGNIDRAQKFAKRSERFTILSFVMSVVMAAFIVAVIERPYWDGYEHQGHLVG